MTYIKDEHLERMEKKSIDTKFILRIIACCLIGFFTGIGIRYFIDILTNH